MTEPIKLRAGALKRITLSETSTTSNASFDQRLSFFEQASAALFSLKIKLGKWKNSWWDEGSFLILWASAIKDIEGKYGSGVGTYFRFIRDLFNINLILSLIRFVTQFS